MAKTKEVLEQDAIPEEDMELKNRTEDSIDIDGLGDRKIGEKIHLKGKTVSIADVKLEPTGDERDSKDGRKKMEIILFRLTYKPEGTEERVFENYGGVTRFIREGGEKSEPTINYKGKSAAANLFKVWLKFEDKEFQDVSFKEFFKGLKGLRAKIKEVNVTYQGEDSFKNVVQEFVG